MKKMILAFALSVLALSSYAATETISQPNGITSVTEEEKKVEIKSTELPANISSSIAESHKGSTISKAYQVLNGENKVSGYEVVVKSGDKEEILKFDAAGTLVK